MATTLEAIEKMAQYLYSHDVCLTKAVRYMFPYINSLVEQKCMHKDIMNYIECSGYNIKYYRQAIMRVQKKNIDNLYDKYVMDIKNINNEVSNIQKIQSHEKPVPKKLDSDKPDKEIPSLPQKIIENKKENEDILPGNDFFKEKMAIYDVGIRE